MRQYSYFALLLISILAWLTSCTQRNSGFESVEALIARRVPWLEGQVVFEKLKDTVPDAFELKSSKGKLIISVTGANAAAMGLNWYLKYFCFRSMSHMGDNLDPVVPLPEVKDPVRVDATALYRYALNFCTYNYTMSFYNWEDWERELDWMALNGVNLMLVANGMEAVWQNTLRQIDYTQEEIDDFLVGPAYTAWWLMGNVQAWGGPMPQSQIDSRKELQKKILQRMKELGIKPVLPGFYGMVPSSITEKIQAKIIDQGNWGAFKRPDILSPTDSAFAEIAGIYYEQVQELYGKDIEFFAGDPFHEGGKTDGVDLAQAGAAIQREMQQYFPGSTWILQGWQDNPKTTLLQGLDKSKVLVQELFGEFTNNWEKREGYESTPFIWCMVNNFGERPGLYGKLQRYADEVDRARKGSYSQFIKGVGIMPEGINNNPAAYDLVLELGWRKENLNAEQWIKDYAHYRYGKVNEDISKAWNLFLETIYNSTPGYQEGAPESVFCRRPTLEMKAVSSWGTRIRNYDVDKFEGAVRQFAQAAPEMSHSQTYRIDLINLVRQVIANRGEEVIQQIVRAYHDRDIEGFEKSTGEFLQMIALTDELLTTDEYFRLSNWQNQALESGNTQEEKELNLHNLMMLITYWGENNRNEDYLHEYAYKEWGGMMNSFYGKRWEIYFNYLKVQMEGGNIEEPDFFAWERQWVENNRKVIDDRPANRELTQLVDEILMTEL